MVISIIRVIRVIGVIRVISIVHTSNALVCEIDGNRGSHSLSAEGTKGEVKAIFLYEPRVHITKSWGPTSCWRPLGPLEFALDD